LGIVILMTTSWPRISRNTFAVARAVQNVQIGRLIEVLFDDGSEAASGSRSASRGQSGRSGPVVSESRGSPGGGRLPTLCPG
ncbi:MAG: hypothetical protein ACKO4Z_04755, partial [Planctomycetota bacterium]